jgi:hypothetical protein
MEQFLADHVFSLTHWPWATVTFGFMIIGQVMKSAVWTERRARTKGRWQPFWWHGYKMRVLHPMAAGLVLGFFWRNPEEGVNGAPFSMCYFFGAGAMSVIAFEVLKAMAKKKGIELSIPGASEPPTPPSSPASTNATVTSSETRS